MALRVDSASASTRKTERAVLVRRAASTRLKHSLSQEMSEPPSGSITFSTVGVTVSSQDGALVSWGGGGFDVGPELRGEPEGKKTVLRKSHNVPTNRVQPTDGTVVGRFFVSRHHVRLLPRSEERPCRHSRHSRNWRNMSVWQIFQQSVAPKPVWLSHSHQFGSKRWLALRPPLQAAAAHSEMLQAVSHLPILVRLRPLLIPSPWCGSFRQV